MSTLIDNGAYPDALTKAIEVPMQGFQGKRTPLHLATVNKHVPVIATLIDSGANVNAQDNLGKSAMHYAALEGQTTILEILLSRNADPNIVDCNGNTPLHITATCNQPLASITLLYNSPAGAVDVNAVNSKKQSVLYISASSGFLRSAAILIVSGATPNKCYKSPLFRCIEQNNVEMLALLIAGGADLNERNMQEFTRPMFYACKHASSETIALLVAAGADQCLRNENEETPLQVAGSHERTDVYTTAMTPVYLQQAELALERARQYLQDTAEAIFTKQLFVPVMLSLWKQKGNADDVSPQTQALRAYMKDRQSLDDIVSLHESPLCSLKEEIIDNEYIIMQMLSFVNPCAKYCRKL